MYFQGSTFIDTEKDNISHRYLDLDVNMYLNTLTYC